VLNAKNAVLSVCRRKDYLTQNKSYKNKPLIIPPQQHTDKATGTPPVAFL